MDSYIAFPELGIRLEIDAVAFYLFNRPIYLYGIVIAFGFLVALLLAFKDAKKYNIDPDKFADMVLIVTPVAIIFARLFYVIFEFESYKDNLLKVFDIRSGGLAIYGGIIGTGLALYVYTHIKKISLLEITDFVAPYFAIAQAIGRFGNFFNQEAFGRNTDLPWGMTGNEIIIELQRLASKGIDVTPARNVHPTFLYEFLWNILVFLIVLYVRSHRKKIGESIMAYMALYGLGRFFIEGLRMDSLMLGAIRVNQILALLFFLGFSFAFFYSRYKINKHKDFSEEVVSPYASLREKMSSKETEKDEQKDEEE